jgi:hypothetical protein
MRWRFFWSRRSRTRVTWSIILALGAVLALVWLVLRSSYSGRPSDLVSSGTTVIGQLDPRLALGSCVALLALLSLMLIFAPDHRKHTYLANAPSLVPLVSVSLVSVYLDAENQLATQGIRPFTRFLMEHLDGRRVDLLDFLDASQTARGEKYKELYRFGFRSVDVLQDPTGKGTVKEAVIVRLLGMPTSVLSLVPPIKSVFY